MLIVHAPNVHQGGGRALLTPLLAAAAARGPCTAILDARLALPPLSATMTVLRVAPTLPGRLAGEWRLRGLARSGDTVLCFGNLPPLFGVRGDVHVFLQNRYLFGPQDLSAFPLRPRLRLRAERAWLRTRLGAAMRVHVQTPSMARELAAALGIEASVTPFLPAMPAGDAGTAGPKRFDFIYVASGDPHKNHRRLIEAWRLLARDGLFPSLCLTLDPARDASLLDWVGRQARAERMRIENVCPGSSAEVAPYYRMAGAFVYPSTLESFGLPLLEAAAAGLPIVAAELDYVRDVVVPAQTFDPRSPVSIARAVRRQLGQEPAAVRPLTPAAFLDAVDAPDHA